MKASDYCSFCGKPKHLRVHHPYEPCYKNPDWTAFEGQSEPKPQPWHVEWRDPDGSTWSAGRLPNDRSGK